MATDKIVFFIMQKTYRYSQKPSVLYSLPNILLVVKSKRMRWEEHVARMGKGRGVHKVLVGKSEGKRPLGTPRRKWEDNIKKDLQNLGCGGTDLKNIFCQ